MSSKSVIYQYKVTLSHVRPPVWRRIQVPADFTLHRMAAVLVTVMGWSGGHLHQFRVDGEYFGLPSEEFGDDMDVNDERKTRLKEIWGLGIKRFVFEYDFGDGWEHVVEYEGVVEPQKETKYPCCIKGARHCPPEDCGGPHGYADFLKAISDPQHPEHKSMREWIGRDFDPDEFDLEELSGLARGAEYTEKMWKARV